jgi:hypothetical protein
MEENLVYLLWGKVILLRDRKWQFDLRVGKYGIES